MSLIFKATQALEGECARVDSLAQLDLLWHAGLREATDPDAPPEQANVEAPLPAELEQLPRAVEAPMPEVGSNHASFPARVRNPRSLSTRAAAAKPPGSAEKSPLELSRGEQRSVAVLRAVLPVVKRILPLFGGNKGTAVTSLVAPPPQAPPARTLPPADLAPTQDSLAALKTQHRELRHRVVEQNASLNRCEDRLKLVREATERNTLEQKELVAGLKGVSNRINIAAVVALGLVAASVVVNIVLYLHLLKVIP